MEWSTKFIHPKLQLNKANTSGTEAPFLDLHLSISNGFVSSKIYDKRDDFDFYIVRFPFLDCDVPRRPSYGVHIPSTKRNAMFLFAIFRVKKILISKIVLIQWFCLPIKTLIA